MKSPICEINATDRAYPQVEYGENEKPTESATAAHPGKFYEVYLKEVPNELRSETQAARPQFCS